MRLHLNLRERARKGFWRALEAVGVERPKERWNRQPSLLRRALPPLAIGLLVLAIAWPVWATPRPSLLAALAIAYGLYLLPSRARKVALPAAAILLVVAYPFYLGELFKLPLFGPFPSMDTVVVMAIFTVMALGLNVVVGYAGLLDLGYVAFYAMGAYTAAWFASPQFAGQNPDGSYKRNVVFGAIDVPEGIGGFHINLWILFLVAGCFTALVGVIIGLPTLRLRGDYLAIVTLGFGEIMPQVARNGDRLFGTSFNLTNGPQGINPIDTPGFGHTLSDATGGFLPSSYLSCCNASFLNHQISSTELFFWTAVVLVLITVFCSWRLRDSRLGRAWIAIREDEVAAAAMGVPLMRTKTWSYATGAFFGGVAGALFAAFKGGVFPDDFFFNISVFILCMVILGGMGNIWGVVVGACVLAYLNQEGIANIGGWINDRFSTSDAQWFQVWSGGIDVPKYTFGIYGAIILIVMLFRPQGLIGSSRRKQELQQGVHDEPLYDSQAQGR